MVSASTLMRDLWERNGLHMQPVPDAMGWCGLEILMLLHTEAMLRRFIERKAQLLIKSANRLRSPIKLILLLKINTFTS